MPFNYATGQYDPDYYGQGQPPQQQYGGQQGQPVGATQQGQPNYNDWYNLLGQQQRDPNMNYTMDQPGTYPGAAKPGTDPVQPVNPGGGDVRAVLPNQAYRPELYPSASQGGYTLTNGNQQGAGATQNMGAFSGNTGTDPNKPPDPSGDWHWQGNMWVDQTGQRDATGRYLTDAEKTYWHGHDQARASAAQAGMPSISNDWERQNKNPGLPAGNQPSYLPYGTQPTAQNPAAAAAPGGPAAAATQFNPLDPAWDYSKFQSVPWQAFVKNVFSDSNGNQNAFSELRDTTGQGLTKEQVNAAVSQYGWQIAGQANPDANAVYRAAITAAQADPSSDYVVSKIAIPNPDGTMGVGYGVFKREQSQQAQETRGFFAPGSTNPNSPANLAAQAQARARASGQGSGTKKLGPTGPAAPTASQVAGAKGIGNGALRVAGNIMTAIDKNKAEQAAQKQKDMEAARQKIIAGLGGAQQAMNGAAVATGPKGTVPAAPLGTPIGTSRVGPSGHQEMWNGQTWVDMQPNIRIGGF